MTRCISTIIISVLFSLLSCKGEKAGILGIEVPTGDGQVTVEEPYLISGVYEEGPAFKAGIRPGDIILQVNDRLLEQGMKHSEVYNNLLKGEPGDRITLTVLRGEKQMVFEMYMAKKAN